MNIKKLKKKLRRAEGVLRAVGRDQHADSEILRLRLAELESASMQADRDHALDTARLELESQRIQNAASGRAHLAEWMNGLAQIVGEGLHLIGQIHASGQTRATNEEAS